MTDRVVLHVGAMKTGTSWLQALLAENRTALRRAGVLVAPHRSAAVRDLMAGPLPAGAATSDAWDRTVRSMRADEAPVAVLSHEYLSFTGRAVRERVAASLADTELHVLVTVRDAAGTLPAQWQTFARNRGTMTWPEYAAAARDPATGPHDHTFVRSQRIALILRQWGELAPGRLHVVTVPGPGAPAHLLWDRVAEVLGVDPAVADRRGGGANVSVGYASAHLLCLLHQHVGGDVSPTQLRRLTMHLATTVLSARRSKEPRPMLDAETLRFTSAWNHRARAAVVESGAHLVGDLEDLPVLGPGEDPGPRARPLRLPDDPDVMAAASDADDALRRLLGEEPTGPAYPSVSAAVAGLTELMRRCVVTDAVERLNPRGTALRER